MLPKLGKFILVGLGATAIQYVVLAFLVENYGLRASVASTIGFVISATGSYLVNRTYTFQSTAHHAVAAPRFLIVALAGATMNGMVVGWLETHTTTPYLLSQTFATTAVVLWNFIANSVWTFSHKTGRPGLP